MRYLCALLLITPLAGCLGETSQETSRDDAAEVFKPEVRVERFTLNECWGEFWQFRADGSALQQHLPPGFELDTSRDLLGTGLPGAYVGVQAFQCKTGKGLRGDVSLARVFTRVKPLAERNESVSDHFFAWFTLAPQALCQHLRGEGFPMSNGTVIITSPWIPTPEGPGFGWVLDVLFDEGISVHVEEEFGERHPVPFMSSAVFYVWNGSAVARFTETLDVYGPPGLGPGLATLENARWLGGALGDPPYVVSGVASLGDVSGACVGAVASK